jgi:hypothetical protein
MERETTLHMLVEGISIFGVALQYWMPIALLIIAAAVAIAARTNQFPVFQGRRLSKTNQGTRG